MSNSDSIQLGIFEAAQEAEQADGEDDLPAESDTDTDDQSSADRPIPIARDNGESTASDGSESAKISEHYSQPGIADVYESLGVITDDGGYSIGNHDFVGWYQERNNKARPWILAEEWDSIRSKVDRTTYATISYAPAEWHMDSWAAFKRTDTGREWVHDTPTPDYSEISAHAPFADIDLADDVKEDRPDGDIPQGIIEAALSHYIDAFAELAGSRDHVFALDSVGGAYIFIAPASTKPIAKEFPADERELIFDDMMDKLNSWLGDVRDDVISAIPETEGTFAPDKLNNKNRLFKAPLSVHTSLDGVVTPMDVAEPSYDYTPLQP
jgi:hypothetical protein